MLEDNPHFIVTGMQGTFILCGRGSLRQLQLRAGVAGALVVQRVILTRLERGRYAGDRVLEYLQVTQNPTKPFRCC